MFDRPARSSAALLSAVLMLAAIPAIAGTAQTRTQSVAIRSSDLNLATESGRAVLQLRIDNAVERICGAHPRTTWEVENYANCSKAARAGATSQFDAVVTAALNNRKLASDPDKGAPVR
ncbi:MAG: UrcA family protein [Rhizomicrobium sp.]